jgi:ABC-2 type transport system ATP-binding protein
MAGALDEVVALDELTVTVGPTTILDSLSYMFKPSSVTAILGPNGAGKTTLLRAITGLIKPRKGEIHIGKYASGTVEAKKLIGYLPERPGLYERLDARENLIFHAKMRGLDKPKREEKVSELLEKFGLQPFAHNPVQTFSKGMKQRLALARTLLDEPPVLLLDEPTSGLDPDGSELTADTIKSYAQEGGNVLLSTHNPYFARRVSDCTLLLKQGRIAAAGKFDDVVQTPKKIRIRLLKPVEYKSIVGIVKGVKKNLHDTETVDDFEIEISSKFEVPDIIRTLIDLGLQLLYVEPSELSYENTDSFGVRHT